MPFAGADIRLHPDYLSPSAPPLGRPTFVFRFSYQSYWRDELVFFAGFYDSDPSHDAIDDILDRATFHFWAKSTDQDNFPALRRKHTSYALYAVL